DEMIKARIKNPQLDQTEGQREGNLVNKARGAMDTLVVVFWMSHA
nr:hypothetical protein [Tanacetum cinerariifolium]